MFLAFFAGIAALDLGAAEVRRARLLPSESRNGSTPRRQLTWIWLRTAASCTAVLLIPLVCVLANGAFFHVSGSRLCSVPFGFLCFLLLPVSTAWICAGIGTSVAALSTRTIPSLLWLALVYAILIMAPLYRFYSEPPVFSYNILIGYFPGNLYDEGIGFGRAFFASRLEQIFLVSGLHCLASAKLHWRTLAVSSESAQALLQPRRFYLGILAASLFLVMHSQAGALGYAPSVADIADRLGGRYETENFIIHYPDRTDITDRIATIGDDHEFRLSQLRALFMDDSESSNAAAGNQAKSKTKIRSFYFANADDKYAAMGARRVYMAKPWRGEIYLNDSPFPHQILKHELAHVVTADFADSLFGVSTKRFLGLPIIITVGLVEGIAVAADWPDHFTRELTPHQSVKVMRELNVAPPIEKLMSPGFLAFSSARSYSVAGSFVHWLLATQGVDKVKELYRNGGDIEAVYGTSLKDLAVKWTRFIDAQPLPEQAVAIAKERYRRESIFSRPCPHAIANLQDRAGENLERKKFSAAISNLQSICDRVPEEPNYSLALAQVLVFANRPDDAAPILEKLSEDEKQTSSTRNTALQARAAILIHRNQWTEAIALLQEANSLPLGNNESRNALIKLQIAEAYKSAPKALIHYLWPKKPLSPEERIGLLTSAFSAPGSAAVLETRNSALVQYLVGRNLSYTSLSALSTMFLTKALDGNLSPLIRLEAARILAAQSFLARDFETTERALEVMAGETGSQVNQLYAKDWAARLRWQRRRQE